MQVSRTFRIFAALACVLAASCSATRSNKIDYAPDPGLRLATPAADEAVVVFLRPDLVGHAVSAALYEGDRFLTILMADAHYVHRTTPGSHRFAVVSESADFLDAELEGGRIYFAEVDPRMGWWRARFSYEPFSPGKGAWRSLGGWLDVSYEVKPNEKAAEWAANSDGSVKQKIGAELPGWLERPDRPRLVPSDGVARFPEDATQPPTP